MSEYYHNLYSLFIDMSFYMVIGLIFTGFLHAFIKEKWIKKQLGSTSASSLVKAAMVGVPLPLCSCGVIPMAVYLRQNGASKGAVMSFLTSTPQTGVDSIIASYGMLGPIFAVYRALAAFISGIVTGAITELLDTNEPAPQPEKKSCCSHSSSETSPETDTAQASSCCSSTAVKPAMSLPGKLLEMLRYAFGSFLDDIALNFVIGLLIAALISTLLPADLLGTLNNPLLAMLLVLIIGIPMYVCSTASIPIALALMMKGLSPGTAFVFLFAGPATNIASIAVLLKVFSKRSIAIYLGSIALCAVTFGLLLDYLLIDRVISEISAIHCEEPSNLKLIVALIFGLCLLLSLWRKLRHKAS